MDKNKLLRKGLARLLSVLMILSTIGAGLTALGFGPVEAYAAEISGMAVGDTVYTGKATDGYTGGTSQNMSWKVIDKDAAGNPLLVSQYLWKGDGTDDSVLIQFDSDMTDQWSGSNAEAWCNSFYSNNLSDYSNAILDNQVFFLSTDEANKLSDKKAYFSDDTATAVNWWLRTGGTLGTYPAIAYVKTDGSVANTLATAKQAARPAMYLDASADICAYKGSYWTINKAHNYGDLIPQQDPTTTEEGVKAHYHCSQCGGDFDENKNPVTEEDLKIDKLSEIKPENVYMARHDEVEEFQEASGGTFKWTATNADWSLYDPLIEMVDASDFQLQTKKVTDSEWTDAQGELTVSEYSDSGDEDMVTITAAIPDNTADYDISWRVIYKHSEVSLQIEEGQPIHITQKHPETQAVKPETVYMSRHDDVEEFQPASGGTFMWIAMNADYSLDDPMIELVDASDFQLQTKKVTDSEWTDAQGDLTVSAFSESGDEELVTITAAIPDNTADYDISWRVIYKHCDVSLQDPSCESFHITQMKPEPAAEPEITRISFDKTEYKSGDAAFTVSLEGTDLDKLDATNFKLEYYAYGWEAYNYPVAPIAFAAGEGGTTATVTFEVSASNEKYRFTVKDHVASTVSNNPQELTLKKAVYTGVSVDPAELTAEGGDAVFTVTGTGLDLASASSFKLFKPYTDDYGSGYTDSGLAPTLTPSADGTSLAVKFALPANETDADLTYSLRVVKPGSSQWNPTYYTDTELSGARSAVTVKASAPAEKPVIGDVYVLSGNTQPAAGGTYSWAFFGVDDTADWSGVTSADFSAQVKVGDGAWTASSATVTLSANDEYDGVVTISVPDNDQEVEKQWRFTYAGGIVDYSDEPADCPAIKQAAKEAPPAPAKPALVVTADSESVSADGGEISWGVWDHEGNDLEGAIKDEDFVVMVDAGNGPEAAEGITAAFEVGDNYDEGTVSVTVPANSDQAEKKWSLSYEGDIYVQKGEGFAPASAWPYITQAAKPAVEPAVEEAAGKIDALPDASAVTAADEEAIVAARAAYDALTEEQKAAVDDTKLKAAEAALKTIKDNAAADNVKGLINDLPAADKVTTADKDKIDAAKAAYDALTEDQKALIDADTVKKLNDAKTALGDAQKAADDAARKAAAEAKAKKVKTVTVNVATVNAKAIDKVVKKKGGSTKYVTKIILGAKVKKISPKAFAKYKKVTVVEVRTKKLTKKSVKNSMKSSKVKTVKVKVAKKAKTNKKYIKKYKKIFVKKNAGKKVAVK